MNEEKRQVYDEFGTKGLENAEQYGFYVRDTVDMMCYVGSI